MHVQLLRAASLAPGRASPRVQCSAKVRVVMCVMCCTASISLDLRSDAKVTSIPCVQNQRWILRVDSRHSVCCLLTPCRIPTFLPPTLVFPCILRCSVKEWAVVCGSTYRASSFIRTRRKGILQSLPTPLFPSQSTSTASSAGCPWGTRK